MSNSTKETLVGFPGDDLPKTPHLNEILRQSYIEEVPAMIEWKFGGPLHQFWSARVVAVDTGGGRATPLCASVMRGGDLPMLMAEAKTPAEVLRQLEELADPNWVEPPQPLTLLPWTIRDPNRPTEKYPEQGKGFRPIWIEDAEGRRLFTVSEKGGPELAQFIVDRVNAGGPAPEVSRG